MLPHALLRIAAPQVLCCDTAHPAWLGPTLSAAPWVVVRRAGPRDGLLPVGVRGALRSERYAAWLAPADVLECLTPEGLARRRLWRGHPLQARLPALAAIEPAAELLGRRGFGARWGPTGAVAFELASGCRAVTPESDLDVMVRVARPLAAAEAAALLVELSTLPARIDALLETPAGALALTELAQRDPPYLLRTLHGPRLLCDPWAGAAAAA